MSVEPRHHRHFVARRGDVLHRISDECGGVMISFPRPGVQSDRVVLKGTKDYIEMAKQRIQEIVTDLVSQHSHAHDENTLQTILSLYPLSYRVPVRERYGSTLLPATRAARPKLYTKSLTRDLKLMYSRFTVVRISINL